TAHNRHMRGPAKRLGQPGIFLVKVAPTFLNRTGDGRGSTLLDTSLVVHRLHYSFSDSPNPFGFAHFDSAQFTAHNETIFRLGHGAFLQSPLELLRTYTRSLQKR